MTIVCCVCQRMEREKSWVTTVSKTAVGKISHGYCPACYQKILLDLDSYIAQQETNGSAAESGGSVYAAARVCA